MSAKFDVGDEVTIDGTECKIVKIVANGDALTPLYLVQEKNHNHFTYHGEDNMSITSGSYNAKNGSDGPSRKRIKNGSSIGSNQSNSSALSEKSWSIDECHRFNIKFISRSHVQSDIRTAFNKFFERDFGDQDDDDVKDLVRMDWGENIGGEVDTTWAKLISDSHQFELTQSEASVDAFVTTLLDIFKWKQLSSKVTVKLGRVDMLSYVGNEQTVMNCAIENKGAAPFSIHHRVKCRNQLAAYIVSMGIENAYVLDVMYGKKFCTQKLLGILHIGLTPIFYKAEITDQYLDSIKTLYSRTDMASKTSSIPELVIQEFAPIHPYTDREIMRSQSSRSTIFKCYKAFKMLANEYGNEKLKQMCE